MKEMNEKIYRAAGIVKRVAEEWDVTVGEIMQAQRGSPRSAEARSVAMWLVSVETDFRRVEIGLIFMKREPATVSKAIKRVQVMREESERFRERSDGLRRFDVAGAGHGSGPGSGASDRGGSERV